MVVKKLSLANSFPSETIHSPLHPQITNSTNGSVVISTLTFLPVPSDDNTKLKCEGSNPRLPNSALEDTLILNVLCKCLYELLFPSSFSLFHSSTHIL